MARDEAARVRQGASVSAGPDILRGLTEDPSPTVRATLALNPVVSGQVNAILARDRDEKVRALLARKLAALTPGLSEAAHGRLWQETMQTLTVLVADEAERVRASIADVVKHMPDAPRAIILRLARDASVMVYEPIIRFSPVLTSEDLVALIVAAPSRDTVLAVARRPRIDADVSDAIFNAANSDAIAALLANPTAQIREVTLDALIARATEHDGWHEPLVRRPCLPPRAARALSAIVSDRLLEVLFARDDLDPALAIELRDRLRQTPASADGGSAAADDGPAPAEMQANTPGAAFAKASHLREAGRLTDASILAAAQCGDLALVSAMLAVKADVPLVVIERASALRSAKGLVSLSWKAGLSMRVALALQVLVGHLQPEAVIRPRPGGGFPMSPREMRWQLEFLGRTSR